jgi:hypothetical protein
MLKKTKSKHEHTDLRKVPQREHGKHERLSKIREKESRRELLTDETEDLED